jgi:hypothetical protein
MIFQSSMGLGKSRFDIPSGPPNDTFVQQKIKTWCHARNNNWTSK